jgi:hypothetical protein
MVGNGEASVRWVDVPKNNVTAVLLIKVNVRESPETGRADRG